MHLQLALIGALDRFADTPRQVDIRGPDQQAIRGVLDSHDPVEGMFLSFDFFLMPSELENLILQTRQSSAREVDDAGGIVVIDPMAGLAG